MLSIIIRGPSWYGTSCWTRLHVSASYLTRLVSTIIQVLMQFKPHSPISEPSKNTELTVLYLFHLMILYGAIAQSHRLTLCLFYWLGHSHPEHLNLVCGHRALDGCPVAFQAPVVWDKQLPMICLGSWKDLDLDSLQSSTSTPTSQPFLPVVLAKWIKTASALRSSIHAVAPMQNHLLADGSRS